MGCCASIPREPEHDDAPQRQNVPPKAASPVTVQAAGTAAAVQQQAPQANGTATNSVNAPSPSVTPLLNKGDVKPQNRFEILPGAPLGKGHFAVVKRCRDLVTGKICAVKIIDKKEMVKSTASVVKQEIEILKAVGAHPNIVQLIDHWEDATKHYLVLELCEGGDLFSQIVEHGKYSEKDAVRCCRQLADALRHIHSCGITHRDLKPENILLISPSPHSQLKLADFGLSKLIKGHLHPMRTVCGTWAYCVAANTSLRCLDSRGHEGTIRAMHVRLNTRLLDEFGGSVSVKAIHTTARNREPLWRVEDARTGKLLFRCTADHKLSFLADPSAADQSKERRRVEIRCREFAELDAEEQAALLAYTASADPKPCPVSSSSSFTNPSHVASAFPIRVRAPLPGAAAEPFVGIEVASATHRFQLAGSDEEESLISTSPISSSASASPAFGVVTSNCAPEVIQRRPYDSTVDNWTLGVLMYILLSGYHPFDVYGECFAKDTMLANADGTTVAVQNVKAGQKLMGEDGRIVETASGAAAVRSQDGVYTIQSGAGVDAYTVTGKHLLTVCISSSPRLSIHASSTSPSGYEARISYLDPSLRRFRTQTFQAEPVDFTEQVEEEASFSLEEEERIKEAVEAEVEARPSGARGAGVGVIDDVDESSYASKPILRGTVSQILSQLRESLSHQAAGTFLVSGQLIEMRAQDLMERWDALRMGSDKPAVTGRRVPLQALAQKPAKESSARIVYHVINEPSSIHANSLNQLQRVESLLGLDAAASEETITLELSMDSSSPVPSDYAAQCDQSIADALSRGASTVVAFGDFTQQRWLEQGGLLTSVDGVQVMHLEQRSIQVIFAPHPLQWRRSRALISAVALAHNVSSAVPAALSLERVPILSLTHTPGVHTMYNISITGKVDSLKRFSLASGVLTHNCPEPELLSKIMSCEYDFDDPVWANVSIEAKSLIKGLLVLDPSKRLSIDAYIASPWISQGKGAADLPNQLVLDRLSKFGVGNKFRALVVAKLASNKFKASISRSKKNGAVAGSKDAGGISLLSDGTPDYLGLGSERNVGPNSARGAAQLGLESVKENLSAQPGNLHLSTPNAFEPSNSGMASARNNAVGVLSVNQLDLVSRRGGDTLGLHDGVLMLHGGGGGGGSGDDEPDTDGGWGNMREHMDDSAVPRSARANSVPSGKASGAVSVPRSPVTPHSQRMQMPTIHHDSSGAGTGDAGGRTVAASVDRKGGLVGHRSHSGVPMTKSEHDSPTP